jgi:hypothetical protein
MVSIETFTRPVKRFAYPAQVSQKSLKELIRRKRTSRNTASPFLLTASNNGGTLPSPEIPRGKAYRSMRRYPRRNVALNDVVQSM